MLIPMLVPMWFALLLFSLWFVGYAAYCFLLVLNETAAGKNQVPVHWPTDPFGPRLGQFLYLLVLLLPCLFFSGVLLACVPLPPEPELRAPLIILILFGVVGFLYPVVLLSVLSGPSHWELVSWHVLRRMVQRWRTMLAFYFVSAPLLIVCALVVYLAFFGWMELMDVATGAPWPWLPSAVLLWSWLFVLPLTAALGAAALLVYARLVGRVAWLLDLAYADDDAQRRLKDVAPAAGPAASPYDGPEITSSATGIAAEEPYALVEERTPEAGDARQLATAAPRQRQQMQPVVMAVETADVVPAKTPAPRRLVVRGIYQFPWYRGSVKAWIVLSLSGLLLAALIRMQIQLFN